MRTHDKRTLTRTTLSSRRELLRALGAAGGAALLAPLAMRGSMAYAASVGPMTGVSGTMLELDGSYSPANSAEGGNAFAEVAAEPPQDAVLRKHLAALRYEEIVVELALSAVAPPLLSWVSAFLQNGAVPKSGALTYLDYSGKEMRRLEFLNALITEVKLPACDAANAKDRASLTLRLAPESTRLVGGGGKVAGTGYGKSQMVAASMFRMNVQGLENACGRIRSVSAPSAKRPLGRAVGVEKVSKTAPGLLDCAPISIVLPEQDAGPFYLWFNDFALKGNVGAERPGRLEFLSPNLATVLATVDFGNLGIVRYAPLPPSGESSGKMGAMSAAYVQVDMFCETLSLAVV